jgi:1-acyl-sn-glycerol-3-phosphate acyltransferase
MRSLARSLARLGEILHDVLMISAGFGWTFLCIAAALVVLVVTRSRRIPFAMARHIWGPGLLAMAGAKLLVSGREQVDFTQPHVFAANHQSYMDIAALYAAIPVPLAYVLKKELRYMPLIGWYAAAMGMVFVDRSLRRGAKESVSEAATALAAGRNVVLFPEGTRSRDGRLGPFKTGGFAAPIAAGVTVVPIAIDGAGWVLPAKGFALHSGPIRVTIGAPIPVAGLTTEDRGQLAIRTRAAVAAMLAGAPAATEDVKQA